MSTTAFKTGHTLGMDPKLAEYLASSVRETPAMQQCRVETQRLMGAGMQTTPEQAQFLTLLVELTQAHRILELGTFTGYSTLALSRALKPTGTVITCDVDPEMTERAQRYWQQAGLAHNIHLILGPALQSLTELVNSGHENYFDLVFIDADKANYLEYYEFALKLVRQGGLIVIDNVLWKGAVVDEKDSSQRTQVIRRLNALLQQDERITPALVPISDGMYLARKR
jgi:predicted O-methyltransferase YrrM